MSAPNQCSDRGLLVRTGDFRLVSTFWKNLWPGMPPSLAKANIMRELAVTENVLPQEAQNENKYHILRCCHVPAEVHCPNDNGLSGLCQQTATENDKCANHENNRTLLANRIQKYLRNRLCSCRVDCAVKILY